MKRLLATVKQSASRFFQRAAATDGGRFLVRLGSGCRANNVFATGAQLAYHLLLALFPLLIFVLSVLGFTTFSRADALNSILAALPPNARDALLPVLLDIAAQRSSALLSASLVLALWSGSSGVRQVIAALERTFDVPRAKAHFLLQRGLALLVTLVLVALIVLMLASQVFGTLIFDFLVARLGRNAGFETLWQVLVGLVPVVLLVLAFTGLYFFVPGFPGRRRVRLGHALLGGVTAALGWLAVSLGFQLYVNRFSDYANTYGSLGGIIVLLIWLYLSSIMIMLGAETAAAAAYVQTESKQQKTLK